MSPGPKLTQGLTQDQETEISAIDDQDNPIMKNPMKLLKEYFHQRAKH